MLHKPTRTYGKRSARSTNGRSTSLAPTHIADSSDGSSQDDDKVKEVLLANRSPTRCLKGVPSSINSTPGLSKKRSILPTASASRVPEVVIYSSKRTKTVDKAQSRAVDSSVPSRGSYSSSAPSAYRPPRDMKGKGRMQELEDHQSISESSSTESDCITVTSKAVYHPRARQDSDEELPNSAELSSPRRSTKRYMSPSPEAPSKPSVNRNIFRRPNGGSACEAAERSPEQSASRECARDHVLSKNPPLKSENSIDSLFDELLGEANPYDRISMHSSVTQDRELLLSQMNSRPASHKSERSSPSRSLIFYPIVGTNYDFVLQRALPLCLCFICKASTKYIFDIGHQS